MFEQFRNVFLDLKYSKIGHRNYPSVFKNVDISQFSISVQFLGFLKRSIVRDLHSFTQVFRSTIGGWPWYISNRLACFSKTFVDLSVDVFVVLLNMLDFYLCFRKGWCAISKRNDLKGCCCIGFRSGGLDKIEIVTNLANCNNEELSFFGK